MYVNYIPLNSLDLGLKCKIQVASIDEDSSVDGIDRIRTGDFITKVNVVLIYILL